ncbi:hypothetical protein PTSG_01350 [Salpingoeca rosetta]|uniref:Methylmalonic aciduria and homocystinuria type D protein n=1 Tax=Salpingoeca rosetta (strain ATCC 50818 / BSB-021) TaxID=946362 RepID=F2U033_SALR5|nr:uncharacterized protein PTSG_01350 [Salpingoeca rosetta]EGD80761.1 hypothetical protein PTSG_01350 [Salpingoeca rosetta]|eukprot:XP_004997322.1 hypothetical protein PTSG_01350 [Salpingoeca rosetta]
MEDEERTLCAAMAQVVSVREEGGEAVTAAMEVKRWEARLPRKSPRFPDMVLPPSLVRTGRVDISVHRCPRRHVSHYRDIFGPDLEVDKLLIIPTFRKTGVDLVGMGPHVEQEKDTLLEEFAEEAVAVCKALQSLGHWADYADPASGLPALGERRAGIYPEVLGAKHFLKYDTLNAGCCQILQHPIFGTKVYPATLFTTAPLALLMETLAAVYPDFEHQSPPPHAPPDATDDDSQHHQKGHEAEKKGKDGEQQEERSEKGASQEEDKAAQTHDTP